MCAQWRLRSAWASAQSDQSLRRPHEYTLGPYLSIEHTAKTLIRLGNRRIRPVWSESSLGAQNTLFVLSCCGIYISRSLSLGRTHGLGRLGLMMMLSHCQLQVASNFDYRRAQSVLRSTVDFNFVGLIPRLILVYHILSVLLSFSFQRRST